MEKASMSVYYIVFHCFVKAVSLASPWVPLISPQVGDLTALSIVHKTQILSWLIALIHQCCKPMCCHYLERFVLAPKRLESMCVQLYSRTFNHKAKHDSN